MATVKKTDKEIANDKVDKIMDGVDAWASFYRANPHRFCMDYLNIKLKPFQQFLIYMMNMCTNFCFIAARGLGKSFLCAVFCCVRCILYPNTKIVIAQKTRGQSISILDEKIVKELMPKSANLRQEIESVIINQQKAQITFKNHSYIEVVTASDNARGHRANLLIVDEFRMLDKSVIDLVLKKFLTSARLPGYLDNPKYAHLAERNMQMYLSSAWFQSHWSWDQCKDYFVNMIDTSKKYFFCRFPYQMSIKEGLLSKESVEDDMSESTFSDIKFEMEMCAKFIGVTDGGLFNFDDINKTRKIRTPFYAPNISMSAQKMKVPPKGKDEIRILTSDIALMSSKRHDNDATSIFLNSMVADKSGRCTSNFMYTENAEGMISQDLALKLRRYFDYFDCDYIGIDARGLGTPLLDLLMHEIYDPEENKTYPPLGCYNNQDFQDRCADKTARRAIWAIMGNPQFNNDVTLALRSGFQQGRIRMLSQEYDCEDILREEIKGYDKLSPAEKTALQLPYINTGLTVNELVNLDYEATNNLIRVHEKAGCRKDRYSSIQYNYYIAQQVERGLEKKSSKNTTMQFNFRAPVAARGGLF